MGEKEDALILEAKREADWKRIANIEKDMAINTLATTRIENTLNEFMKKFEGYPVYCEKVKQHDKLIWGGLIGIAVMLVKTVWAWVVNVKAGS